MKDLSQWIVSREMASVELGALETRDGMLCPRKGFEQCIVTV